jgi:K+-transporting ATPase KdpF subunit
LLGIRRRLSKIEGNAMNAFYIVGAIVSVALLIYLLVALVKAEEL